MIALHCVQERSLTAFFSSGNAAAIGQALGLLTFSFITHQHKRNS